MVAFDESALLSRARDSAGRLALAIGDEEGQARPARNLLRVRRDEEGGIWFSGLAAEIRPYARAGTEDAHSVSEWRDSGFKADVFAGVVIGVS